MEHVAQSLFDLEENRFLGNRTSRRGAAGGPSGMNADHLRPVLDSHVHSDLLFKLGETPPVIVDVIRLGRTIAQQMSDVVEAATALYQHALSTRAGTECIAHILQTLTEDDPRTTVLSIDGIGTFDLISRKSMLEALMIVEGGPDIMPFVRQFYGQPSTFLWETTSPYTRSNRVKGANKVTH